MGNMRHASIVVAAIVVWVLGAGWYTALADDPGWPASARRASS